MVIPGKFHPKNYTSKLNFEKKKFRFPKGASGSVSKSENANFGMSEGIFFFFVWKKKLIIVFFGVKFTGVYRNVAITSTLFRDHN